MTISTHLKFAGMWYVGVILYGIGEYWFTRELISTIGSAICAHTLVYLWWVVMAKVMDHD